MSKIYAAFLLITLLLSKQVSQAQSINLLTNSSQLCAGQAVSISFTTSGTFLAGNTFRVQLSSNYGTSYTDLPGSFTSSPASVTLPAGRPSSYYVYRVVADKPQVFSSASNSFRINDKPTAQLISSSAGSELQNPYTPVSLNLLVTGGSPYVYTLQNGQQLTSYTDGSTDIFPVAPAQTTTYSLVSVQNNCGTGPASGSATVLVNAVGFRLLERTNESFCLGAQLPIYFSTTGLLPANSAFEAELINVNDGNRSVTLPVTGSTSPLLVTLPKQLSGSTYGYKLRIYSKAANISAWFREGSTFSLLPLPRLALTAVNPSIALGGQTTLKVLNQSLSATSVVVLNDGRELTLYNGADASTIVAPTATTSYSIVSFTGACSEAVTYDNRKVTVTVRPGARIDSLSAAEVCAGQPITLYYSTTPGFSLPSRIRVQYIQGGTYYSADARLVKPGQLVFTPPVFNQTIQSQVVLIRDAQTDTLITETNLPLLIRGKPDAYLVDRQLTYSVPGLYLLPIVLTANGRNTVLLNTGDKLAVVGTSPTLPATSSLPIYVSKTTTYSIVSVSNDCGTTAGTDRTTTVTIRDPTPAPAGLILHKADLNEFSACPGTRQDLNLQLIGTFNADNQFMLELSRADATYAGTPQQSFTTTPAVSFTLPTAPGNYRVRITSTSPFTRSDDQYYYVAEAPKASVFLSALPGSNQIKSLTVAQGQPVIVYYTFQGGRGPYRYELANGTRGQSTGNLQVTDQPTTSTNYGIVQVTDACGRKNTVTVEPAIATVLPALSTLIRTGSINASQVCVQTPMVVPFVQVGSLPASASYVVQLSEDQTVWETIPTSGTASPLLATLPISAAGKQVYYRVAALSSNGLTGGISSDSKIAIRSVQNVTLTAPSSATVVSLERGFSVSLLVKAESARSDATSVIVSNGTSFVNVNVSSGESSVNISQPGTYSLVSSQNSCGYGTAQGVVRVVARPYVAQATTNGTQFCAGNRVTLTYAVGGELNADNKVSIYLVNRFMGGKQLLTESTSLSGVQSFTLDAGLSAGTYGFELETTSPQTVLAAGSLDVEAPVSVTLSSGGRAVYQNETDYIPLTPSTSRSYSLTLATPGGQSIVVPNQTTYYIPVRITQSGNYSIAAVANRCGLGRTTGVTSITAIPTASVTIRPDLNFSLFCTSKNYVIYLNTTGTFDAANAFTAYLSDSTGANARTLPSVSRGSQLTITIPADLPGGDTYVLRVGSSSPQHLGASSSLGFKARQSPTGTLTGNTSISKGDSTRLSVALTGTAPWQLTITDFFGARTFTANTSPFSLTVKPDTTSGYRLTEVRDNQCGVGTASGTALITVSRLLAIEPALLLQVRAYPNPTAGWVHIEGDVPDPRDVVFELHTLSGTLVERSVGGVRQGKLEHRIDLSGQPAGGYVLTAEQAGRRSQFKLIKQ